MADITAKTTLQAMERQPTGRELDFAAPTQYRFQVQKLPDVTFFYKLQIFLVLQLINYLNPHH